MNDDMHDVSIGPSAPAPGVQVRAPGLRPALQRLLVAERGRARSTMIQFTLEDSIKVTVMEFVSPAKDQLIERWSYELPTLIRGRLVASVEDWAKLELEAPIGRSDLAPAAK